MIYITGDTHGDFTRFSNKRLRKQGMQTGYFSVVAHPGRCFRRCKEWTKEMEIVSKSIISTAQRHGVVLEETWKQIHC